VVTFEFLDRAYGDDAYYSARGVHDVDFETVMIRVENLLARGPGVK
jgi:hypothetical protein